MDTLKEHVIYTLKVLLMYIKKMNIVLYILKRTCYVYNKKNIVVYTLNELVMYIKTWTRNVYNKILFIEYILEKHS